MEDGVVAKILVPEGTSDIEVGTPVLVIAEEAEDVPAFADFTAAAAFELEARSRAQARLLELGER